MARLIDADAYAIEMKKRQDACHKWKSEQNEGSEMYARAEQALVTFVEAWLTLEKQPTIDAIPVSWLEEQRDKLSEAWDEEWHEINGLIEQWREEQGAR